MVSKIKLIKPPIYLNMKYFLTTNQLFHHIDNKAIRDGKYLALPHASAWHDVTYVRYICIRSALTYRGVCIQKCVMIN